MSARKGFLLRICCLFLTGFLQATGAQEGRVAGTQEGRAALPASSFALSERGDWSRYSGGRYAEHVYRESRAWLTGLTDASLAGQAYLLEGSLQAGSGGAREVSASSDFSLGLSRFAAVATVSRGSFPSHRALLAGAPERLEPGTSWIGEARYAFLAPGGIPVELPVLVEYRMGEPGKLGDRPVATVKALFALRWQPSVSRNAGLEAAGLQSVSGRHELDLYLEEGSLVFIRDRFDDSFTPASGPVERRSGFILAFARAGARPERGAELAAIAGAGATRAPPGAAPPAPPTSPELAGPPLGAPPMAASPLSAPPQPPTTAAQPQAEAPSPPLAAAPEPQNLAAGPGSFLSGESGGLDETVPPALEAAGVDLLSAGQNLVLRVKDLRFVADSDAILATEKWRLDAIYAALAALPGRSFLVEGHAAGVGKPEGELELSKRRAKKVVDELVARGLDPSRLIWRGLGSSSPLAPNDNEDGRAKNRRVEITILE